MFATIMTWIGAVAGMAVLVAMALGTFFVDFDGSSGDGRKKAAEVGEATPPAR